MKRWSTDTFSMLHLGQLGGNKRKRRCEWVSLVCPIRRRVMTISCRRIGLFEDVHGVGDFFICSSLLFVWFCHVRVQIERVLFLSSFFRSVAGGRILQLIFGSLVAHLAALSTVSAFVRPM